MTRPNKPKAKSLRDWTEKLGLEVAKATYDMKDQPDKFPDMLDALKVLTTLQSVLSKTQQEPEGGGIDEFTRLFGSADRRVAGDTGGDPDTSDEPPDFEPTESTGVDDGVQGTLDGVGGAAPGAAPGLERNGAGLARN